MDDPRLRMFDVTFPELEDIEPLFTRKDYKVYDQYADGDPFEDENYIKHFRLIRQAIGENRPVKILMENRHGREVWARFYPRGLEYSLKDDKIRILTSKGSYQQYNLGRVRRCAFYSGNGPWHERARADRKKDLTIEIVDDRNALERAMLHFAHFEKQAERMGEKLYRLKLKYDESDETEMVIRILSFGPCIKVIEPDGFVERIRKRLILQKSCELK